jgi:hypothetical protein
MSPLSPSRAKMRREKIIVRYQGMRIVHGDYLSVLIPVMKSVGMRRIPIIVPIISVYCEGFLMSS